jgi:proliferating cell nuclear antigen
MKLTLTDTKYIKEPVSIISDLVSEAKFKIGADHIELIAMDPANVAMVVFKLFSSCFVEYAVKEPIAISINLANLKQVLRRTKPSDTLTLEIAENKLKLTLKGNSVRTFFLPILDLDDKEQRVPELKFAATITLHSDILNEAIDDVDIVGESVSFIAEEHKFTIMSAGDLNKAMVEIKSDDSTKIITEEKVKSKYSIEYLKKMIQAAKISDTATLQFNKDYPLRLEYKTLNKVQLSFILAPRVEND